MAQSYPQVWQAQMRMELDFEVLPEITATITWPGLEWVCMSTRGPWMASMFRVVILSIFCTLTPF